MKKIIFAAFTLLASLATGQNLVENGSFENTKDCPIPFGTDFDDAVESWEYYFGTPDYYNRACGAEGHPDIEVNSQGFDGNAYAGLDLYGDTGTAYMREYLHVALKEPLEKGKYYRVTFYVKPVNDNNQGIGYGINNIGLFLSNEPLDSVPDERFYDVTPQIAAEDAIITESYWTAICGVYYAQGGERHITIGNFSTDLGTDVVPLSNTTAPQRAYYLVDYVQVLPNDLPELPKDTIICENQRIDLRIDEPDVTVQWNDGSGGKHFLITTPGIYTARISNPGCSYVDTLVVEPSNCDECKIYVPNAFTPNGDGKNDVFRAVAEENCEDLVSYHILIYDRWGQKVFEAESPDVAWDGRTGGDRLGQGVYTYTIEYEYPLFRKTQTRILRGTVTLLK